MMDFTNQLPIDPQWVKNVQAEARRVAEECGCLVVLAAVQENGKIFVCASDDDPEDQQRAFYKEVTEDIPGLLLGLARVVVMQDALGKAEPNA